MNAMSTPDNSMKMMKALMLLTNVGFVLYWLITALRLIPAAQ